MTQTNDEIGSSVRHLAIQGVGDIGDLSSVRPFRINTMQENLLQRSVAEALSGIPASKISENPWGFPVVPFPEDRNRSGDGRLVLAPSNVDPAWLVHPIFWIDPELTSPSEAEQKDTSLWNVRMFYLIMAMGLWDMETLKFRDAPLVSGVRYAQTDIDNYRQGYPSIFDQVRYGSQDLLVPYEDVERQSRDALVRCKELQQSEWDRFRSGQETALREAERLSDEYNPEWTKIDAELQNVTAQVLDRVENARSTTDLVDPAYQTAARLANLLVEMDRCALLLNAPISRALAADQVVFARILSSLKAYDQRVNSGLYSKTLSESVSTLFSLDGRSADADFAKPHVDAQNLHLQVTRRLQVAIVNYGRLQSGQSPFGDYAEMSLVTELLPDDGPEPRAGRRFEG